MKFKSAAAWMYTPVNCLRKTAPIVPCNVVRRAGKDIPLRVHRADRRVWTTRRWGSDLVASYDGRAVT